ncbi:MAG TPA: glycoside hydrolase family 3 N-terminal domain-containing protein [Candidatus Sulfotelmatobacter sp.]|nr:glycoside hydrolase family 3 N-terminal domain-containing protein [Candidatus Sulfotelmatobacter sp.]
MKKLLVSVVCLATAALFVPRASSQQDPKPIYKDPNAAIADRVHDLLAKMTVEEKVAQLESGWVLPAFGSFKVPSPFEGDHVNETMVKKIAGNGLGTFAFLDEFLGARESSDPRIGAKNRNLLQAWVLKNTRLGIPIMYHGEALHGAVTMSATAFPAAVGLGSTWDPELLQKMFTTVGLEARASGNALVLAPVLDLSRDPRYGRVEEMYSEDPYLVAQLGTAAVKGLQGMQSIDDRLDDNHVYSTLKHFVHGQPENGTNVGPNDFSERTMRSVFLYPFEQVVKNAHVEAVMPSYNENNGGIPSHANTWLLQDILRREWSFTGLTVSDYTAVEQLAGLQHVAANNAAAGVVAFKSGLDMELPTPAGFPGLVDAVNSGKISEKDLDAAVGRVLSAKFRAGLFEHPYVDQERAAREVGNPDHAKLARQVADETIVLLKNKDNILPLDATKFKTIAVIGPNGKKERLGGYSGLPKYYVSVFDGLEKRAGSGVKVVFAEGCRISEPDAAPNINTFGVYQAPTPETDRKLMQEAVEIAKSADVIVFALGGNEIVSRESIGNMGPGMTMLGDSDSIELPGRQNELVHEIVKLGKPMVAVLLNGKAYAIEQLNAEVPAILEGWYLGQETGNAVAGVLFGDVNPSGHLPVSIARNVGQLPVYYYKTPAARRGYVFHENSPLFPFGFGLSYTTFTFGTPTVDHDQIASGGAARLSVTVTNSGSRAGDEVVQLYVHHVVSSVVQPVVALKGFKRIHLEPKATTTVTFDIGADQLSILNVGMRRVVEPGSVDLRVGPSSAETTAVRLTVVE